MYNYFIYLLKGFFMGVAETIPAISGSTIALFLGIYERMIHALHAYLPHNIINIFKKKGKTRDKLIKDLDFKFLFTLFIGMTIAIFSFSHLLVYLYENHRVFLLSFFIGFIIASTIIQGKGHLKNNCRIFAILGFAIGFSLFFLEEIRIFGTTNPEIFLLGFIIVLFGLLPGVSGSFMLLILGKHEFILRSVKEFNLEVAGLFLIGALTGIMFFIGAIKKLLVNAREKVLTFFYAFILGSVSVIIEQMYSLITLGNTVFSLFYLILGTIAAFTMIKMLNK